MLLKRYSIATAELLLIFPAVLFMTALFVRNLQPQQYEPAHTAQQIVTWYAMRPRTGPWVLLIFLPFAVLLGLRYALAQMERGSGTATSRPTNYRNGQGLSSDPPSRGSNFGSRRFLEIVAASAD